MHFHIVSDQAIILHVYLLSLHKISLGPVVASLKELQLLSVKPIVLYCLQLYPLFDLV